MTAPKIKQAYPCLWFNGQARTAAEFYCSVFPESRIISHSGPVVHFELSGQPFMTLDANDQYRHSPAISFVLECPDQNAIDAYWNGLLAEGGKEAMCGWLTDRFGVSWQVIPEKLGQWLSDPQSGGRATQAMLQMRKLDIETLQNA